MEDLVGLEQMQYALTKLFGGLLAQRMVPELVAHIGKFEPDLILSEVTEFAGGLVAEKHGLPAATAMFGMIHPTEVFAPILASCLGARRKELGLDPDDFVRPVLSRLQLVFAPPSYQFPGVKLTEMQHLFQPQGYDQSGDEQLPGWVQSLEDRPTVYATLGTIPAFNARAGALEVLVDALSTEDINGIITVGRNQDPASLGTLPDTLHVERYIPQSLLFPLCTAAISHGGYGTTMGALSHGVPLVLIPQGADQPMHAERCQDLGVGEMVPVEHYGPDAIRTALRKVLSNTSYKHRALELQREIEDLPPITEAVRLLERYQAQAAREI
jgi:MGT family glycosyltransferase